MMLTKIGRYQIKEELGRGGMATVYLAHDPRFNRDVAIKLLPHELLHHPTFRTRFEREAKIVAALDIPAIVPVYDYGEEDGQPYLVMRHMAGGTLADRLENGVLSLAETVKLVNALAPALDEAHAQNIIHRDLKPSNILFDHQGNPFVSDFGTALMTQIPEKLTETGGSVGTPAYMSPEQIRGERTLDGRSDVYALGIVAFEALSGKHPYQTDTPIGVAVKHIIDPIPRILDTQPNLPAGCQTALTRAMAKNREDRFPTATAFARALDEATAVSPPAHHTKPTKQRAKPAWQPLAWGFLGVLLIAAFIISSSIKQTADDGVTSSAAAASAEAVAETATAVPTATTPPATMQPTRIMPTPTSIPTGEAVSVANETAVTITETIVIETPIAANAPQSASIFANPDPNSSELDIIQTNEAINIIGRSENGHWLYVSSEDTVTGFVFAAQLGWQGDVNALPVIQPTSVQTASSSVNSAATAVCSQGCPQLKIDAYPLPGGRCEEKVIYRTVYMRGQGGSGVYTYFWNDEQMAGPTNEGFGFEVNNLSGAVIGTAKVISSDGQMAERELFISEFSCN